MPCKILIVEDNEDIRDALVGLLTFDGFEVSSASDGVEGLARARAWQPDLVITDFNMPNLDGAALIGQIRQDGTVRRVSAIIVMTAYPTDGLKCGDPGGPDVILRKPVAHEVLMETVGRFLATDPGPEKNH